jgi:hypothetical protein
VWRPDSERSLARNAVSAPSGLKNSTIFDVVKTVGTFWLFRELRDFFIGGLREKKEGLLWSEQPFVFQFLNLVVEACNHPNLLVLPFSLELIRTAA